MSEKKRGLGRGLGALIPAGPETDDGAAGVRFDDLPMDSIEPNPRHPQFILTIHGLGYKFAEKPGTVYYQAGVSDGFDELRVSLDETPGGVRTGGR